MDKRSILLVDDDRGNLVVLEAFLLDDYKIRIADSGPQAISILDQEEFDIIISDQRMPGMTGVEMLTMARKKYPDTIRIILSAYSDSAAMLEAINEGNVYRFLIKPWDPTELSVVIRQALDHRDTILANKRLLEELSAKNRDLEESLVRLSESQDKLLHSAKLATIGRLTSALIHEFQNQLNGVPLIELTIKEIENTIGVDELLLKELNSGLDSLKTAFTMAKDMHSFVRNEQWTLKKTHFDVSQLVEEAIRFAKVNKNLKHCEIEFNRADIPDCYLDRDKIKQVLINLLTNAADATADRGHINIFMDPAAPWLAISISDDGPGVPEELREKIWKPFFTTKDEEGLGLGLDITRNLVEVHGGSIRLEPTEGQGATFTVTLPIESK